jgi:hypothetical protein
MRACNKRAISVAHSCSLLTAEHQREWNSTYFKKHYDAVPKAWNKQPKERSLLLAEAESLNNRFVALGIVFFEVVEQATPLADQHKKTAA